MPDEGLIARGRALWPAARNLLGALGGQRLQVRSMALAFLSLFALVPALVVAFSVVQAFTGMGPIWERLDEFLLANLAVGARASIEPYLARFVKSAHAASAGLVGGALLVYSALSLFGTVEQAVNDIWHVRRRRPLKQLVLTYWAGLTLGPILLAGSLTLGHSVEGFLAGAPIGRLAARGGAVLLTCAFFAVIYLIVPATKVRPAAAAVGGVVAGLAFEIAKGGYTFVVARFFRYHAVYGSLAAIPIFLIWLQLSWTLLLFGARVAFVAQHLRVFLHGRARETTPVARERLAAQALLEVARAYRRGGPPPQVEEVADRLDALPEAVRDVLSALRQAGLVTEAAGGGLLPSRPLAQVTLADVRAVVAGAAPTDGPGSPLLAPLTAAEDAAASLLSGVSYEDLCARAEAAVPTQEERPAIRAPEAGRALR